MPVGDKPWSRSLEAICSDWSKCDLKHVNCLDLCGYLHHDWVYAVNGS